MFFETAGVAAASGAGALVFARGRRLQALGLVAPPALFWLCQIGWVFLFQGARAEYQSWANVGLSALALTVVIVCLWCLARAFRAEGPLVIGCMLAFTLACVVGAAYTWFVGTMAITGAWL